jgi:flavin-dependent dehydrogenase
MQRGVGGLHEALERYLARVGVTDVSSQEQHGYVIPVRPRRGGFVRGRVLVVGDAAGFADALTGEGISIAMISAKTAARSILSSPPERIGADYARAIRRELLADLRIARGLAWITYRRRDLARALFRARGPKLAEGIADVFLGARTYRSLVTKPSGYIDLLRRRTRAGTPG